MAGDRHMYGEVDDKRDLKEIFSEILDQENIVLTRVDRARLFEAVAAEILGFVETLRAPR